MEKDLIITEQDLHGLNLVLTTIVDEGRVDIALIINKSGRLVSFQSETSEYDATSLAALVSGNFASSSSIANILGESEFTSMVQKGENKHLYVSLIDSNTIFTAIFDKRSTEERIAKALDNNMNSMNMALNEIYSNIELSPEVNMDLTNGIMR